MARSYAAWCWFVRIRHTIPLHHRASRLSPRSELDAYARTGGLAHLDVDREREALVRRLRGRGIVVSLDDGELTCAPTTPGSIDLPPRTADFLFSWAPVGTTVVVY